MPQLSPRWASAAFAVLAACSSGTLAGGTDWDDPCLSIVCPAGNRCVDGVCLVASDGGVGGDAGCVPGPLGEPTNLAAVNTEHGESSPWISPDGLTLLFASDRPGGVGGYDLWWSTRPSEDAPFEAPRIINGVNSEVNDTTPSISSDRLTLYFASFRDADARRYEIFTATRPDEHSDFGEPAPLVEVNTGNDDRAPSISADGLTLLLSSARVSGMDDDICIATRAAVTAPFGEPVPIEEVNSDTEDLSQSISTDGLTLYFGSQRLSARDIFIATRSDTSAAFREPEPLVPISSLSDDYYPSVSSDDWALFFASDRPNGRGGWDIWVSTRRCQ